MKSRVSTKTNLFQKKCESGITSNWSGRVFDPLTRPKGSRNKATIAIESLLQGQAEALTQTTVTKALEGDSVALRLCMERIAPAPKDQPVSFSLPKMNNAMDASEAARSVLTAVSEGQLTPIEGTRVMGLIDSYRRTLELTEIEARLQALEIQSVP